MDSPLEEHGSGWTVTAEPTNWYYGRLVRQTYRSQAPLIPLRGEDDG